MGLDRGPKRYAVQIHPSSLLLAVLVKEVVGGLFDVAPAQHVVHSVCLDRHPTSAPEQKKDNLVAHRMSLLHHILHIWCLMTAAKATHADKQGSLFICINISRFFKPVESYLFAI